MREYGFGLQEKVIRIVCDSCGKEITEKEDHLHLEKTWGYFSRKDGENHQWDICEDCYDKWVADFGKKKD